MTGMTGLTIASACKESGVEDLVVLEARTNIGGVWRLYGNPHSRVNSSEPAYRIRVQREQPNTEHSHFFEMIDDLRRIVNQYALSQNLLLSANVSTVCRVAADSTELSLSVSRAPAAAANTRACMMSSSVDAISL